VHVLGAGGVGKSYLMNRIAEEFKNEGIILSASTGVAFCNINCQTIHRILALNRETDIKYDIKLFDHINTYN